MDSEQLADEAAPLDALLVDAALGPLRQLAPDPSTVMFAVGLARRPLTTARRLGSLAAELARIGVGTSALAPAKRDRRFTDPAWTENPLLRRIVQAYLAAGQTADQLVNDAALDWRDDKRVRFLAENLEDALSPSNVPLVNPASAKAAIDTAGLSLVHGGISLLRDMATKPRIPEMVDTSSFEVGRNIAVTPGAVVLRTEILELIQYRPQTERVREVPLLIVPPTINKYYAIDLAPGRSLVEYLVQNGQQVFVISWRNPDARHAGWGMSTYVQAVLDALDAAQRVSGAGRTALIGTCAGGIIASITAGHLAAAGQAGRLSAFGLFVTVLDTAQAGLLGALTDRRLALAAKAMSRRRGYLDGRDLAEVFAWLRPGDLVLELLGEQLSARQEAARVRRLVLECRHDPDERRAAWRFRRPGDRQQARDAGSADGTRNPHRPVAGRHRRLHRRGHRGPHHTLAELLPEHKAARRQEPVHPVYQRSHRRVGESAR